MCAGVQVQAVEPCGGRTMCVQVQAARAGRWRVPRPHLPALCARLQVRPSCPINQSCRDLSSALDSLLATHAGLGWCPACLAADPSFLPCHGGESGPRRASSAHTARVQRFVQVRRRPLLALPLHQRRGASTAAGGHGVPRPTGALPVPSGGVQRQRPHGHAGAHPPAAGAGAPPARARCGWGCLARTVQDKDKRARERFGGSCAARAPCVVQT